MIVVKLKARVMKLKASDLINFYSINQMKEVSKTGHFTIDLPSSDAATALSGPGNSFLKKFESLTGVSLTIRLSLIHI